MTSLRTRTTTLAALLACALTAALPTFSAKANPLVVSSLPRGMSISSRISSQLNMETVESVSLGRQPMGMSATAQLKLMAATGQWRNTELNARWAWRQPYLQQELRASLLLTRFSGLYDAVSDSTLPDNEISHMSTVALNYGARQSLPFIRTGFSLIYTGALQYSSMDLHLDPQGATAIPSLSSGLTRLEVGAFAHQDLPIRSYIHASAFGGLSLAYRHLSGGSSSAIGPHQAGFNLDDQDYLENRLVAGVEVEYNDKNLLPGLHLTARLSMGIRLNGPSIDSVYTKNEQGQLLDRVSFNFEGDNVVDQQLSLKASYQIRPRLTAGLAWMLFYQGNFGTSLGGQLSYAF